MAEQGLSPLRDPEEAARLLAWYDVHRRDLPWRAPPGHQPDPYGVWLSEVMLQQTTVGAVKEYYRNFLAHWPTVRALAAAPLDDVLRAWAGLGYYARARNLHACAKAVAAAGGEFPSTEEGLRALPGVGAYTAGAIAAIAFDRQAAAVDGNVERVIARYYAIETPLPAAKPEIRDRTLALVPAKRSGDFAQAMMDLGATICTPRSPNCLICPWMEGCEGRRREIAGELPRKAAKVAIPARKGIAFWITRDDGAVLLRRRAERGLLGGMMEIPSTEWALGLPAEPAAEAPLKAKWQRGVGRISHTFTHFHLVLDIWRAAAVADGLLGDDGDYRWVAPDDLAEEALPTVMRKIVAAMGIDVRRRPSRRASAGAGDRSG
ncbi:A/G-specific adenine glycosylase [soil metagenome]